MEFRYYTETLYTNNANVASFKALNDFKKFAINLAIELNECVHYYYFVGRYERSGTINKTGALINYKKRDYSI
jgi:hypothetical protein